MSDREGALIVFVSMALTWLLVVATMPAWNKPAVMAWAAIAFGTVGTLLWVSSRGEAGTV